jgi:hypothetical protein
MLQQPAIWAGKLCGTTGRIACKRIKYSSQYYQQSTMAVSKCIAAANAVF